MSFNYLIPVTLGILFSMSISTLFINFDSFFSVEVLDRTFYLKGYLSKRTDKLLADSRGVREFIISMGYISLYIYVPYFLYFFGVLFSNKPISPMQYVFSIPVAIYIVILTSLATKFKAIPSIFSKYTKPKENSNKLLENMLSKTLNKTYSKGLSKLTASMVVKSQLGVDYEYQKTSLQDFMYKLSKLILINKDSKELSTIIESFMQQKEMSNLMASLLNLINDTETLGFILTTEGSYTISDFVNELNSQLRNLKEELNSMSDLKDKIKSSELLLKVESITNQTNRF